VCDRRSKELHTPAGYPQSTATRVRCETLWTLPQHENSLPVMRRVFPHLGHLTAIPFFGFIVLLHSDEQEKDGGKQGQAREQEPPPRFAHFLLLFSRPFFFSGHTRWSRRSSPLRHIAPTSLNLLLYQKYKLQVLTSAYCFSNSFSPSFPESAKFLAAFRSLLKSLSPQTWHLTSLPCFP